MINNYAQFMIDVYLREEVIKCALDKKNDEERKLAADELNSKKKEYIKIAEKGLKDGNNVLEKCEGIQHSKAKAML